MRQSPLRLVPLALAFAAGACTDDETSTPAPTAPAVSETSSAQETEPAPPASTTSATTVTVDSSTTATSNPPPANPTFTLEAFPVPAGSGPHDVSPALDGRVWFTAQDSGQLGLLDPATGESQLIDLGDGSQPHGVITAPDGAAWVTDGGRNTITRVDALTGSVTEYPLPSEAAGANLNTAVFGAEGVVWFTGQGGWYGNVDANGAVRVFAAPRGRGPYGITATPTGEIYFASLAGSYVGRIDPASGEATVLEPPVPDQGSRRVWADTMGRVWVSAWNSGDLLMFDPASSQWRSWRLPGDQPQPYAVFVDETDAVWLSDFGANALVRFDPPTETFASFPLPSADGAVRQLHGRTGEIWGAESAADQLVVVRHTP